MLKSVKVTMSSSASSSDTEAWSTKASAGLFGLGAKAGASGNSASASTSGVSNGGSAQESKEEGGSDANKSETSLTKDEIIVEGGHQHVAGGARSNAVMMPLVGERKSRTGVARGRGSRAAVIFLLLNRVKISSIYQMLDFHLQRLQFQ